MRRALCLALLILLCLGVGARTPAQAESELPAAVAEEQIAVGSDYRGSIVTVFGVNSDRRGRGDIVVVLRGPDLPATMMRKRHFLGLWVNGAPVHFAKAPSFFAVLSTRPLREIAGPHAIWTLGLDPAASALLTSATPPEAAPADFRAALVRLRTEQGLYSESRQGLTLFPGGLFRASFRLPANAPIAEYHADTYLFRNGHLVSSQSVPIRISRVGFERRIHDLATHASLLYGLLTLALALGAGWTAAYFFRRA